MGRPVKPEAHQWRRIASRTSAAIPSTTCATPARCGRSISLTSASRSSWRGRAGFCGCSPIRTSPSALPPPRARRWRSSAIYLLTAAVASRRLLVVAAALLMASEYDLITWGIDGWRDDTFMATVVFAAWAFVRLQRTPDVRTRTAGRRDGGSRVSDADHGALVRAAGVPPRRGRRTAGGVAARARMAALAALICARAGGAISDQLCHRNGGSVLCDQLSHRLLPLRRGLPSGSADERRGLPGCEVRRASRPGARHRAHRAVRAALYDQVPRLRGIRAAYRRRAPVVFCRRDC